MMDSYGLDNCGYCWANAIDGRIQHHENCKIGNLQALADKRLVMLKEYKVLLMMIINQRKASVGGLENIYMPQLNREYIDKSCAELAEAIAEE